jgi:hypothetical protein
MLPDCRGEEGPWAMAEHPANSRLEVLLKEADLITQDVHKRLEVQRQSFNYALIAFGVAATVLANEIRQDKYQGHYGDSAFSLQSIDQSVGGLSPAFTLILLLLPVVVGPLGYIFFDDELIIYRNLFYLRRVALPKIRELSEPDDRLRANWRLLLEQHGLINLTALSLVVHMFLSVGRWLLFIVPTAAPVIYGFAGPDEGWWKGLWSDGWASPRALLFALDCAIASLLIVAVVSAVAEQIRWRFRS